MRDSRTRLNPGKRCKVKTKEAWAEIKMTNCVREETKEIRIV